jgi:hypothetical protein
MMPTTSVKQLDRIDNDITERLRAAQARIEAAERELAIAKQQRLSVIDEAMGVRWSLARIGEVIGLSKQRVQQIRRGGEA